MAGKFKIRAPKITRASAPVVAQGQTPLVAQRAACPLCGSRAADTKVSVGPISMEICTECSEPLWHGLGLAQWAKKFFK